MQAGEPRTPEATVNSLREQLSLATHGVKQPITELQTQTGTKDKITTFFVEKIIKDRKELKASSKQLSREDVTLKMQEWLQENVENIVNPLMTMPSNILRVTAHNSLLIFSRNTDLDPHADTPVELLHTILLGIEKYAWHMTHTSWKPEQKSTFATRLESSNIDSLTIPPIRSSYIINYANSLIGRQFKTILQTATFHIHDMVPPLVFDLWKAIGELAALLWFPEIYDMAQYLV